MAISLMAALLLGWRAFTVQGEARFDPAATQWFIDLRSPALTVLGEATTFLGSTLALLPLSLALVGLLSYQRRWPIAGLVALGMLTSLALTILLKDAVGRPRPSADTLIGAPNTGIFPVRPHGEWHSLLWAVGWGHRRSRTRGWQPRVGYRRSDHWRLDRAGDWPQPDLFGLSLIARGAGRVGLASLILAVSLPLLLRPKAA